jgi:phosphohistidine phosphatase
MPKRANKTLILVRHAKSSWSFSGLADADRPLNARGERDAPVMANWFLSTGYRPDLLMTSFANRALTTARIFAHALNYPVERIRLSETLYEASANQLLETIRALDDELSTLMLFGHNPGFNDLLALLLGSEVDNMATCAVAILNLPVSRWSQLSPAGVGKRRAEMVVLQLPKRLRNSAQFGSQATPLATGQARNPASQQQNYSEAAMTLVGDSAPSADLPPTQRSESV